MSKPHIFVDRTCGAKHYWNVVSRKPFDDLTHDERDRYHAAFIQCCVLNVISYIKFRDNDNFSDDIYLMESAINLRMQQQVDVVHLVIKWLSGKPNALRSVTRELSASHMTHLC